VRDTLASARSVGLIFQPNYVLTTATSVALTAT
jgi:hypothetical protein